MKRHLLLIALLLNTLFTTIYGRDIRFTHYSTKDGLSQNIVMCTLQDHNGTLWFATWNGINRFDGYGFISYKLQMNESISPANGRINWIGEDKYGYLWMVGYDYNVYRFDPRTETFEQVTAVIEHSDIRAERIIILSNGDVWVIGVNGGAIRFRTDGRFGNKLSVDMTVQRLLDGRSVNDVVTDATETEWVLTDNGVIRCTTGTTEPTLMFADKGYSRSFHASCSHDNQLFLATSDGSIFSIDGSGSKLVHIKLPIVTDIKDIDMLPDSTLMICTGHNEVFVYNLSSYRLSKLLIGNHAPHIRSAYIDKHGLAWFRVKEPHTVCWFNRRTMKLKFKKVEEEIGEATSSNPLFNIHEDVLDNLWVHPYAGGFSLYDRDNDSIIPFSKLYNVGGKHISSKIHSAMSDNQGNLWLCTHSNGLEKVSFIDRKFDVTKIYECNYASLRNNVRTFCRDNSGALWVGLKNGLIAIYDRKLNYRGFLTSDGTIGTTGTPLKGVAYHIMQDKAGNIWIGTRGDGVLKLSPDGSRYSVERFTYDGDNPYSLSDNNVYFIHEEANGRMWFATFGGGINYMDPRQEKQIFISHRNEMKQFPIGYCRKVRHIASDRHGNIWLGTSCGAVCFSSRFKYPGDIDFKLYTHVAGDDCSLSDNEVHWIQPTKDGKLYLLTFGGGLCRFDGFIPDGGARFSSIQTKDGMPSDVLLSSQEDSHGNLWISSENGIIKYVPSTGYIRFFADSDVGIDDVEFNEAASYRDNDGIIYFGSSNGFISFSPDSIINDSYVPPIIFSQLSVMNKVTTPMSESSVLKQSIDYTDKFYLPYNENTFCITFAAQDMLHIDQIKYRYRLDGIDKDWVYSGTSHSATYTNLSPGNYKLHVMSTNSDGVWCNNERSISIVINPPLWQTPWAYIIYAILTAVVIYIVVHIFYVIFRLRHEVDVEQKVAEAKLRFFTDISHELRTPLTLITGPLDCILQKDNLPDDVQRDLSLMKRNTDRMLRLVNQILDFRKIQSSKMKLRVKRIELVEFMENIMKNFTTLAEEHHIDFVFYSEQPRLYIWADDDKLEKIVFNLLSNAFKYTPDGRMVKLLLHEFAGSIAIEIADQGIGIPKERRSSLFERFENHLNKKYFSHSSTGLGLSLTKELVELHGGNIKVEDIPAGGTSFTVELPKGMEHFGKHTEFIVDDANEIESEEDSYIQDSAVGETDNRQTLLIVEDNKEMSCFLRQMFVGEFTVYTAANGAEGLEKSLAIQPDLIISDVMMPEMDGVEMVKRLRSDMATSHIPIILLTAKSDIDNRLKGLEVGADDYMTKPFSSSYLRARVDNLLKRHIDIYRLYSSDNGTETVGGQEDNKCITKRDQEFLDSLRLLIDKNIDNTELMIGDLATEMAMSRTVFFKKLKSLTGLAPNEFLREVRITKAAQLLDTDEYSISQIADMVGICGSRYFAKCFKQKFGMTATEYKNRHRDNA